MAEESRVKVYGMWASAYVLRVKLALRIKGVEYEYIEEDLANKSEQMLQYNPVSKKVPVLVHNGLPLAESLVILEYIDETWTNTPYLLPKDSYQRAKHRFWAAYFQQVSEIFGRAVILSTQGKQTDEMMKEFWNKMDVAEEFVKEILPNSSPSLQENFQPRYLDIVLYSFFGNCDVVEEFLGVKPLCTERFPLLTSWIKALCEIPEFKEVSVPVQKLVEFLRAMRQNINLSAPQA